MKRTATSGLRAEMVGGADPHYIASGVLGKASFSVGVPAAYLGLMLQWARSVVIAAIYWFVTAQMPRLRERWWLGALFAGVAIFVVMNFIVMPFSAGHPA